MGRRVIVSERHSAAGGEGIDSFASRVVKYIPADVVAGWIAVSKLIVANTTASPQTGASATGAASAATAPDYPVLWGAFVVFLILTALWTWKTTSIPGAPVAKTQIIVSTISFAIWVFGLGVPFTGIDAIGTRAYLGSVVLIIWTLIVGLIVPPRSESAPPPNNP